MTQKLEEQIKVVAEARQLVRGLKNEKKDLLDRWEQKNKELLYQIDLQSSWLDDEEAELRDRTLKTYKETGNKAPAVGVGIRERIVLTYDNKIAFDWAKAHKMALKLDISAFEKIAKVSPPEFVKITTEPQATIATELPVIS